MNWWKFANIDREFLHIFWMTWGKSIKFSRKMCLKIILKVTKNLGFTLTLSVEDTFFEKPQGGIKLNPPPSPILPSHFRVKFVKKTSMSNPVKSLRHIMSYSSSSTRPVKTLSILSDTTVRRFTVDWENLKPYWKSQERAHFSWRSGTLLFTTFIFHFLQDFTKHKKETNRVVFFSCRPLPNILKYRNH